MISAKVVCDSIARHGGRLTTFEVVLPKTFQAQLNTHRKLSKNAASARAIPVKKFLDSVAMNPVIPIWTRNKPGMVGKSLTDSLEDQQLASHAEEVWLEARDNAMNSAMRLMHMGIHKQTANRLLEPFFYTKVVLSSTEYNWFYFLRDHGEAQGEIEKLAKAMKIAAAESFPTLIEAGEYHLPYVLPEEREQPLDVQLKISVARCARTSYRTFDDDRVSTVEKDCELFDDLLSSMHLSPFEHQGTPTHRDDRSGNFDGWIQYRQQIGDAKYREIAGL